MKRIVLAVLLWASLLGCVAGCASDEVSSNQQTTEHENEQSNQELLDFLDQMQKDDQEIEKIQFYVEYEDIHRELKQSGEYANEFWHDAMIMITVDCNYDLAVDEDWYKACADTELKTLNTAFFNEYSDELSEDHFSVWVIAPALYFQYDHTDDTMSEALADFYADYAVLKRLVGLEYVTSINIGYYYSVPGSYFDEDE